MTKRAKNNQNHTVPAKSPLRIVFGSLAVGVLAMTVGVLAPALQLGRAEAEVAAAASPNADRADLFPVIATPDAVSADELRAIQTQLNEAQSTLDRHHKNSNGAVALLARHAHGG